MYEESEEEDHHVREFEYLPGYLGYDLQLAAKEDNQHVFVEKMKELPSQINQDVGTTRIPTSKTLYWPTKVLQWVCQYSAVNCATAWLENKCGVIPFINYPLLNGSYPLHWAAEGFSPGLVNLFINHGAWTDVRSESESWDRNLLPLDVSLEMLSFYHLYLVRWTPDQSICKLIIALCLWPMKKPLEMTRLLARSTKEVGEVFLSCIKYGRIVSVAALLLIAREEVMALSVPLSEDSSGGSLDIRNWINHEISTNEGSSTSIPYSGGSGYGQKCLQADATLRSALALVDVFENVGGDIEMYAEGVHDQIRKDKVATDLKAILARVKDDLTDDDINLEGEEEPEPLTDYRFWLRHKRQSIYGFKPRRNNQSSLCKYASPFFRATPSLSTPRQSHQAHYPGSPILQYPMRPYHTLRLTKGNENASVLPGKMQLQAKRPTGMETSLKNFFSSKKISVFPLVFIRGMTRI